MIPPELPFYHNFEGYVFDRLGTLIGQFEDPQHAEWICQTLNPEEWRGWEDKIQTLESKIESLQAENEDLRSGLDNLRK